MTSPRLPLLAALALLLTGLAGCEHPPLEDASWARRARAVVSGEKIDWEERLALRASYGPEDDRDDDDLADLHEDDEVGAVTMKLGAGVHELKAPVDLLASEVLIEGKGAHETVIALDADSRTSLQIGRAQKVVLRGVTLVGMTGGGIRIKNCPQVVIEDVVLAGLQTGFELIGSTARVGSSVLAGCHRAFVLEDSTLTARECAFVECWEGVAGRGTLDAESCAWVDGRTGISARLDRRSRVVSCLFAGQQQLAGWDGRPGEARANLANLEDLGDRMGPTTNRLIRRVEEFPDDLPQGLPPDFDQAGVHLALQRSKERGEKDPPKRLRDFGEDQAIDHAKLAREALVARRVDDAKREARTAVRYLMGREPLPDEVAAVTDLAAE